MNKKNLLGLLLFACLITTGLFVGANFFINHEDKAGTNVGQSLSTKEDGILAINDEPDSETGKADSEADAQIENKADVEAEGQNESKADSETEGQIESKADVEADAQIESKADSEVDRNAGNEVGSYVNSETKGLDGVIKEPWLSANPTDTGVVIDKTKELIEGEDTKEAPVSSEEAENTFSLINEATAPQLILDSKKVNYQEHIPEMIYDSKIETALDISNPSITIDATAAILFDADTKEVLYYKNPIQAVFPASTAKLLTALVALGLCKEDEEVIIGEEVKMIASDATRAYLKKGEILTIRNLLEGMLLPSGNDAAYVIATYVGRKSLQRTDATKEMAVMEFVKLMNKKAKELELKNSCFKTPDGYDALGQYTTAYDMGLIGIAAAENETIIDVSNQGRSRNIFVSGEDVTWNNTNKLVTRNSGQYYAPAIGLKTGTSTMAGKCLVAAAEYKGKKVVCAIMHSSSTGRWKDAIALLQYGLK